MVALLHWLAGKRKQRFARVIFMECTHTRAYDGLMMTELANASVS